MVSSVARGLDPLARQHHVSIRCEAPDVMTNVDRTRIEHALGNLLSNAIIHGGPGEVAVRGRIAGDPHNRSLLVEVLDRGPGLGDEPTAELFSPFRPSARARGAGSGLGLATVASAVRAHRGTFGAENRPGGGAQFWLSVPAEPPAASNPEAIAVQAAPPRP